MKIETKDFTLSLERVDDLIWVMGDPESLACFKDTVELAGHCKDAGAPSELLELYGEPKDVRVSENGTERLLSGYLVHPGTVSLWLSCEVLNYL